MILKDFFQRTIRLLNLIKENRNDHGARRCEFFRLFEESLAFIFFLEIYILMKERLSFNKNAKLSFSKKWLDRFVHFLD